MNRIIAPSVVALTTVALLSGCSLLGGSTVRYRLYSAWGLTAVDIVRMVLVLSVTFWIGLFAISGVMFIWRPVAVPGLLHLPLINAAW